MTTEDAAATLGLSPSEIEPELVERNYRLKAMHCHPDRARYPGAEVDFKRATEAFNRLKQPTEWPLQFERASMAPEIVTAAEEFLFGAAYCTPEPWLQMSSRDWLGKLTGSNAFRKRTSGIVKKDAPLAELCRLDDGKTLRRLLIAPVDLEVVTVAASPLFHTWCLRPLQTDQVRRRLQRMVADGSELTQAIAQLQDELYDAARLPLDTQPND